jgi:hypothetical protein
MGPSQKLAAAVRSVLRKESLAFSMPLRRAARGAKRSAAVGVENLEGRTLPSALGVTSPAVIRKLAAAAYVWGLAPEIVQRLSTYRSILGTPLNTLDYASNPAAWNNGATYAGDSSTLYINGFIDFRKTAAMVLTVPSASNQYYVANILDDYINTVGSIGTRTTPSDGLTSYLLVGPHSPYVKDKSVVIDGYRYPVMASDTFTNWIVIRVGTNTLIGASDPQSIASVFAGVSQKFALNSLSEFEQNGHQPVYPSNFITPPPTPDQLDEAAPFQNLPDEAADFFHQVGTSVRDNPIPYRTTGLSGTLVSQLPTWVVPQFGAKFRYVVPAYGQKGILRSFAPIGLTPNGFSIPKNWGPSQLAALQQGYVDGRMNLNAFLANLETASTAPTNYWAIVNRLVGTYANNALGYLYRAAVVLAGGSANVPLDAVYPTMTTISTDLTPLDGNHTYKITFLPPPSSITSLPVVGTYPPMVNNDQGNPRGFWSIALYQPDSSQATAPFLSQAGVLNTSYSPADTAVVSVNADANTLTVAAPAEDTIMQSTPILFGANAGDYGLTPGAVYYVADAPTYDSAKQQYTFQISQQWKQDLSADNVPIQDSGGPGPIVSLTPKSAAGALLYGVVKPVSQLGSAQLVAGQLAKNADGSVTLWISPSLPAGVAPSNWIPSPSTAYFKRIYNATNVSTSSQLYLRMYYPAPGTPPPSILPYKAGRESLNESYIPPILELVS